LLIHVGKSEEDKKVCNGQENHQPQGRTTVRAIHSLTRTQTDKPISKTKKDLAANKRTKLSHMEIRKLEKERVSLFFTHNTQLGPPY